MTFGLQQLFQISLERGLCFNHGTEDFFTWAGKSSASMFCHFNSSRAIVLLQLGRTEKANPVERQGTQVRDQRRVIPPTPRLPPGSVPADTQEMKEGPGGEAGVFKETSQSRDQGALDARILSQGTTQASRGLGRLGG
jgi:hypothetical protein